MVDLGADGLVAVEHGRRAGWRSGVAGAAGVAAGCGALEDLRWYLEDYLRAPFGVCEERGPQVQARLAGWGEAVFAAVFGGGPARDAYRAGAGPAAVEVVFRSAVAGAAGVAVGADA